jgi:hypothetical protein
MASGGGRNKGAEATSVGRVALKFDHSRLSTIFVSG